MPKTGIHWFRHGLRLHDNPALLACQDEVERFIPIFIFDGKSAGTETCGYVRLRFLLQSLQDLESQFKEHGINFMCFHGEAHNVLENLIKEWEVRVISFEKDSESIWHTRDNLVKEMCARHNVQVIECVSNTLYDPEEVFSLNSNQPPNTCEELRKSCYKIGEPEQPVLRPDLKFIASHLVSTDDLYDPVRHKVPDLDFFNIKPENEKQKKCIFIGGETKALELCKIRIQYEKESFIAGKLNPNLSKPVLFTKEVSLSPYLRFGCLSVRKLYADLKKVYVKNFNGLKNVYCPVEQLFWREYFYQLSYKNEKFAQVDGNPMCFKIPWDYHGKQDLFLKWESGQTGFPWIDACMRQLVQEGWIHHVCRNSVALFLTRGVLFMSWERGMRTFLKYLIDADWSVCSGNWNWIATGDPEEVLNPNVTFCPVKYGKKIDPKGEYIKNYVPELRDFPLEYLHEPWKAPLDLQEKAGCVIGKDYPEPIVDNEQAFRENIAKLQQFFHSERKEIFETFLNDKNALKPANSKEYRAYTFAKFLESEKSSNGSKSNYSSRVSINIF